MKKGNLTKPSEEAFQKTISDVAKDVVAYAFRNGPVEDIHAEGRISDPEMKCLNKYMVNRISEVLYLMMSWRSKDLENLLLFASKTTSSWDDADFSEMDERIEMGRKLANLLQSA